MVTVAPWNRLVLFYLPFFLIGKMVSESKQMEETDWVQPEVGTSTCNISQRVWSVTDKILCVVCVKTTGLHCKIP